MPTPWWHARRRRRNWGTRPPPLRITVGPWSWPRITPRPKKGSSAWKTKAREAKARAAGNKSRAPAPAASLAMLAGARGLRPLHRCRVLLLQPRVGALAVLLAVIHVGATRARAFALGDLCRLLLCRLLALAGLLLRGFFLRCDLDNSIVEPRVRTRAHGGSLQLRKRREGDGNRQGQDGDKGLADAHSYTSHFDSPASARRRKLSPAPTRQRTCEAREH